MDEMYRTMAELKSMIALKINLKYNEIVYNIDFRGGIIF